MLRDIFAERVRAVPEPALAAADLSLWVPDPAGSDRNRLPTLFHGCTPVLRSRSIDRLLDALHGQFEDHARRIRDDVVAVELLAVVDPEAKTAALLPRTVRYRYPGLLQLIERQGGQVVDGLIAAISPESGALVIPPGLRIDRSRDDDRSRRAFDRRIGKESAPPGHYQVVAWFRHNSSTSRSALLVQTLRRTLRNGAVIGLPVAMEGLAEALRGAELVSLSASRDNTPRLARSVLEHLRSGAAV